MTASGVEGVVRLHLDWMRVRNLRPNSIYNRCRVLARVAIWAEGPILYLSERELRRWQVERSRQIGAPALRGEMSNAREFYRWAVREGFRDDDPTIRLDMPRVPRGLPRPIADVDLARAISEADPARAAALGLACFAGLRACEIAALDWAHVGTGVEPYLRVEDGKGGRGRLVPLSPPLLLLLSDLSNRRGPVIGRADGAAGHNHAHTISHRMNEYLHGLGIPETLHQARHRFASTTYQACRDIRAVQDLLGHASPSTTALYTASSPGVAVQAVLAAGRLAA